MTSTAFTTLVFGFPPKTIIASAFGVILLISKNDAYPINIFFQNSTIIDTNIKQIIKNFFIFSPFLLKFYQKYLENKLKELKDRLDKEVLYRDNFFELSSDKPDPVMVARKYNDENIALICALFAYGKASLIVKFLNSLNFELLHERDEIIQNELKNRYYRFQKHEDVVALFISLKRLKEIDTLENIFHEGFKKDENILQGIENLISKIYSVNLHETFGYNFLVGSIPKSLNPIGLSPYKRVNMFIRWMVRCDNIDMGLWNKIDKKDILMPLDTHTFKVSRKLKLLDRKVYDFKAVLELTDKLKEFDLNDPIKYDFALYRLGQEKII
ncbi:MAG: TIGR02757 family protein [Campylobacterales bacterium]|nr:TIGR02757 family protein [Campylobacterales bacterium]